MTCTRCYSSEEVRVRAYCSENINVYDSKGSKLDYIAPVELNIGEVDCIDFVFCLKCGQIQGQPFESYYKS